MHILSVSNMHKKLIIETLQLMEPISKSYEMSLLWKFKHCSHPLMAPFYCVYT